MTIEERFINFLHALGIHREQPNGAHAQVADHEHEHVHEVFQASTLNALLEGVYDGDLTYGTLREHGDFGLGTFNGLDGEMIALDGAFYQIRADGKVYAVTDDQQTPFAVVQWFAPETEHVLPAPLDFAGFQAHLQTLIPTTNFFYAIKVAGTFAAMKTRSVPKQQKPYPPLTEIAKHQPEFELTNVSGTLIGFRFPDYAAGFNMPGYHLHFITDDRTAGGHVLAFELTTGTLWLEHTTQFHLELPESGDFAGADLDKDQSAAIEQVEGDG